MEVVVASERSGGEPTKRGQQRRHRRRKGHDEAIRGYKRRRTPIDAVPPATASPSSPAGGSKPDAVALENSSGFSRSRDAPAERGGEVPLCSSTDRPRTLSEAKDAPGSSCEVIVIESDDDEETQRQKDLKFEGEIAALKAEIATLEMALEELESKEGDGGSAER